MNKSILKTIQDIYSTLPNIDFIINEKYKYKENFSNTILIHFTYHKNIGSILCQGLIPGFCRGINDVASDVVYFWEMSVNYEKKEIDDKNIAIFVDKCYLNIKKTDNEIVVISEEKVPLENIIGYIRCNKILQND